MPSNPITLGRAALVTVNLAIPRGADLPIAFRYQTGKPPNITPVDLTGWTAIAQIRDRAGSTAWATLTSAAGQITLGADGRIQLTIRHALTASPAWDGRQRGRWALRLTSPSGDRIRFAEGEVTVTQDMTSDA